MIRLPDLIPPKTYKQMQDSFGGYNAAMKIPEGEWNAMQNMSSDHWPMMASRKPRGRLDLDGRTTGILAKDKLVRVTGGRLFYDDEDITVFLEIRGYHITSDNTQLVSMGSYIVIFPDNLYISTADYNDCGSLDNHTRSTGKIAEYAPCDKDGALLEPIAYTFNGVEPPDEGELRYWLDCGRGGAAPTLKEQVPIKAEDDTTEYKWVDVPEAYLRISCEGIGRGFKAGDFARFAGMSIVGSMDNIIRDSNGKYLRIAAASDDFLAVETSLVIGTQGDDIVSVDRNVPEMDYVIETGNRLWGCKYGMVGRKFVNEIYCCKLGDFRNWNEFQLLPTDSYVSSCGTDGPFTGAIAHQGKPLFFKETALHKVYVSDKGAHQILPSTIRGVQEGCSRSLAIVNEVLYYKSRDGICAYDGSVPVSAGDKLGQVRYFDAAAGACNGKYYISMCDSMGAWSLFVYDTKRGLWHREDSTHAAQFAAVSGELYFIDAEDGSVNTVNGTVGTVEGQNSIHWSATSGVIGYTNAESKYVSRFNIRMKLPRGASMNVYIEYDSSGLWKHHGNIKGNGLDSFVIPIRPRRCDHYRLRIEGSGEVRVYSIAKILEIGSDM